jgi:hypothetical protein
MNRHKMYFVKWSKPTVADRAATNHYTISVFKFNFCNVQCRVCSSGVGGANKGSRQSLSAGLGDDVRSGREAEKGVGPVERGGGAQKSLDAVKAVKASMLIEFRGAEGERVIVVKMHVNPAGDALDHSAVVKGGVTGVRQLLPVDVDLSADVVHVSHDTRLSSGKNVNYKSVTGNVTGGNVSRQIQEWRTIVSWLFFFV